MTSRQRALGDDKGNMSMRAHVLCFLLLSKLQIVELNAKDAHDIFHLLSGLRVGRDSARPSIDPDRFGSVLAADWGWWRTVTGNLAKLPDLLSSQPGLAPPYPRFDALTQAKQLLEVAETAGVKPNLSKDRISGARVGWLLDAAQALEAFLDPQMRSPSVEACGKRLERSKTRLKQKHRQNPSSV